MTVPADDAHHPVEHDGATYHFCCVGCRDAFLTRPARRPEPMLLSNDFEVAQPVDKVWAFFGDVPQVAACLPGAALEEDLGDDTYGGGVGIRMGPVKLEFAGKAQDRRARRRRQADGHRRRPAPTRRAAARPR